MNKRIDPVEYAWEQLSNSLRQMGLPKLLVWLAESTVLFRSIRASWKTRLENSNWLRPQIATNLTLADVVFVGGVQRANQFQDEAICEPGRYTPASSEALLMICILRNQGFCAACEDRYFMKRSHQD